MVRRFGRQSVTTEAWLVIVNGIEKHATEMTEETQENHLDNIGSVKGNCKTETNINANDFISNCYATI